MAALLVLGLAACTETDSPTGPTVQLSQTEAAAGADTTGPRVWTGKDDYVPTEVVDMLGSGWQPDETITLTLAEYPEFHDERSFTVTADSLGNFMYDGFRPEYHHAGVRFLLSAVGQSSGFSAQTTFTDGIAAGSSSKNSSGGSGMASQQITINAPAVSVNDVLVAQIVIVDAITSTVICPPSGWTSILNNNRDDKLRQHTFWFRASAAASATSYTWQFKQNNCDTGALIDAGTKGASGGVVRFTGVITSGNPIDASGGGAGSSSGPYRAPAVTTTTANTQILRFFGVFKNTDISDPAGAPIVPRLYHESSSNTSKERAAAGFNSGIQAAPGSTGTYDAQLGSSAEFASQTIALKEQSTPTNTAPVAAADSYSTNEDVTLNVPAPGVLGNDTDAETPNSLQAVLVSGPSNGTLTLSADGSFTYTPAANYNGPDSFTYRASDGSLTSAPATVSLTVNPVNDVPVASNDSYSTDEDTQLNVPAVQGVLANDTDADGDAITASLVSGPSHGTLTLNANGSFTYTPAANYNGPDSFTYKANDASTASNTATVTLTVNAVNDVPDITSLTVGPSPAAKNTTTTLSATFTDVDLPGDPHTALIDWGDATTSNGTISGSSGTTRSVSATHQYAAPGVYTVTLTVTDGAGAFDTEVYQFVVIYDPNGGFVTGGGWINSPAGAYYADPTLTDRAQFGFVSKYQKGATAPTGQTQFQYHVGDLNFHTTVYEWLLVSGSRAQYKGSGTINGSGDYGFLLSAVDGQVAGGGGTDKFRIKIWDKNTGLPVYDNMLGASDDALATTVLSSGNIVIHAK